MELLSKSKQTVVQRIIFIGLLLVMHSCMPVYLSKTPVPRNQMAVSEEIKYIETTDQTDRKKGFMHIVLNDKKGKLIIVRDSIRATRIHELYLSGVLTVIFISEMIHGVCMKND